MNFPSRSVWSLAWRESRTARRRLLLYMSSISLGAAALVAIDSFSANILQSVREQSRALMGGDVSFSSSKPFPAPIDSLIDSLSRAGTPVARVTTFPSMAVVPR
ncbi:MAG: ABC transporter permease, partial [Gemmatimonadaceae bacterium]|nr:ABC transporter permease [Gemmatimonadaceae bacterium]